jgi:chromosome segregation ATPase
VESKTPPSEELQTFIKQQLHNLQMEMAKYEELVVDNRKVNESNDTLRKQAETQHQHSARLEEQIKTFQQANVDLKANASQLQRDLDDLDNVAQDPQAELSELEQAILELRGQLGKAELDLKAANGKVDKVEHERKGIAQEAAKYKVLALIFVLVALSNMLQKQYETAKAGLLKFDAESKKLCEKITESCQSEFKQKEDDFNGTIRHLEHARHEKEQMVDELRNQLKATKNQFDTLRKDAKTLESDIDAISKEQTLTGAKLKTAQLDSSSQLSEIATLKKCLRQKTEELEAKTRDYTEAEHQHAALSNKLTDMECSCDRLQAEVSQQRLTMETMRQETDDQLLKAREEAEDTLQSVRNEVLCLQQGKKNLLSQLEHARSNETRLNNTQATISTERAGLQQQVAELRDELDTKDAVILRIRADAAEKSHKLADTHRSEVADWSRRLLESDAALKEAEAKHRLAEDQFQTKLAADHKLAETKLLDAEQRYLTALQAVKEKSSPREQLVSRHSIDNENTSVSSQNTQAGKSRKKANRNNHSILGVGQNLSIEQDIHAGNSQAFPTGIPSTQRNDFTLFEEQAEAEIMFVEPGLYLVDPEAESVPETQEVGSLTMSGEVFHERLAQASQQEKKFQNRGSTDLSSIESDDLEKIQMEMQPMSLRGNDHSPSKHGSSQKHAQKTPMNSDNVSVAGSRSSQSQDRPRSQANTASRMMPPPKNVSQHLQPHTQTGGSAAEVVSRYPVNEQKNQRFSSSGTNTPDFLYQKMSTSKLTYSQQGSQIPARTGSRQSTSRVMDQSRTEKRKSPSDHIEKGTGAKKQRTSSQSYPIASSSGSRNGSPRSSVADSQSKKQVGSSYMQGVYSATSREKTRGSSSSVQPRTSSQFPSSCDAYSSRREQRSSSQAQAATPMRRISSRVTRSTSKFSLASLSKSSSSVLMQWF